MKKQISNSKNEYPLLEKIILPIIIVVLIISIVMCFFITENYFAGYSVIVMALTATVFAVAGIIFIIITPKNVNDEDEGP